MENTPDQIVELIRAYKAFLATSDKEGREKLHGLMKEARSFQGLALYDRFRQLEEETKAAKTKMAEYAVENAKHHKSGDPTAPDFTSPEPDYPSNTLPKEARVSDLPEPSKGDPIGFIPTDITRVIQNSYMGAGKSQKGFTHVDEEEEEDVTPNDWGSWSQPSED